MTHAVFISYAVEDKLVADSICNLFEANALKCWIAPRDIVPGTNWSEAIIGAITNCSVMVLVFSSSANRSAQIHREVERAVDKGVPIILFIIELGSPSKSLEFFISTSHWLNAFPTPQPEHYNYLLTTVLTILNDDTVRPLKLRSSSSPVADISAGYENSLPWGLVDRIYLKSKDRIKEEEEEVDEQSEETAPKEEAEYEMGPFLYLLMPGGSSLSRVSPKLRGLGMDSGEGEWTLTLNPQRLYDIGRTSDNYIMLNDAKVSRNHAFITYYDDAFVVVDGHLKDGKFQRSRNGTTVNGSRFFFCRLKTGDRIEIGNSVIVVKRIEYDLQKVLTAGLVETACSLGHKLATLQYQISREADSEKARHLRTTVERSTCLDMAELGLQESAFYLVGLTAEDLSRRITLTQGKTVAGFFGFSYHANFASRLATELLGTKLIGTDGSLTRSTRKLGRFEFCVTKAVQEAKGIWPNDEFLSRTTRGLKLKEETVLEGEAIELLARDLVRDLLQKDAAGQAAKFKVLSDRLHQWWSKFSTDVHVDLKLTSGES